MTERAAGALGVARVGIWMFDETGQSLVAADRFSSVDYLHWKAPCCRWPAVHATRRVDRRPTGRRDGCHERSVTSELADSYLRPLGIASMLDAPIVRGGRTIGVICHNTGPHALLYETELAFVESCRTS